MRGRPRQRPPPHPSGPAAGRAGQARTGTFHPWPPAPSLCPDSGLLTGPVSQANRPNKIHIHERPLRLSDGLGTDAACRCGRCIFHIPAGPLGQGVRVQTAPAPPAPVWLAGSRPLGTLRSGASLGSCWGGGWGGGVGAETPDWTGQRGPGAGAGCWGTCPLGRGGVPAAGGPSRVLGQPHTVGTPRTAPGSPFQRASAVALVPSRGCATTTTASF